MKILIKIGAGLLISLAILLLAFFILRINPKPEIIKLERRTVSDEEIDKMALDAVGKMTLEEKVTMMTPVLKSMLKFVLEMAGNGMKYNHDSYQAGGNARLNIPTVRFFDGPRGLVSGEATCFPVSIARAASFDRDLEYRIGDAIGKEVRAAEGNYFGGVCINLLRHPAGGRAQEGYGEDSYLTGQMGVSLMKGVQSNNVMACVKHYAVNNQENTRFDVNVEADERVLREVYLSHFRECVNNGAASVMGSYNKFRGDQACASQHLLTTLLKEDWGFRGFVISDFIFGVKDTELSAKAGLDIEMPATIFYGSKLLKAVKDGRVPENHIDESAFRIARTVLKYETAPDPLPDYPESLIGSSDHIALALEAAERSMVLMQNNNKILPFDRKETKRVVVAGKLAVSQNIGDHGSSRVRPAFIVTPFDGLKNLYGSEVEFIHDSGENTDSLKAKISMADAVVYVVGYNHDDEGEYATKSKYTTGGDRKSLRLHEDESRMIRETAMLSKNSVVVLIGGSAIIVEEWKDKVRGIIHAFYPGMEGGTAIARVLFGDVNPGGKLPFTVASDESHYPEFDINATEVTYDRYHGYIKLDHDGIKASFPFGFGLSYTEFSHDSLSVACGPDGVIASLNVTNTGDRKGDQVIQLYIGFDGSKVEREHKLLKGFERVSLNPGETRKVSISCPFERLRYYDPETGSWVLEKIEYQLYMGPGSEEGDLLKSTFSIG
ncbi:MAG: glycoside hydrolase family 3 C-terminal domain-containing protein [Bacteroidales bacterium]|nr:glycoside hydrolase family 3 C-terminal domain-containing protein [Bacteroidales bacterium]